MASLGAVERGGVGRSTRHRLEELMKIIRAPLREERIVVRKGLKFLAIATPENSADGRRRAHLHF